MSEQKKHGKKNESGSFIQYLSENKTVAALLGIVAVIVIAAGIVVGFFMGKGAWPASAGSTPETPSQTEESEETLSVPLEVDAHSEVNDLMTEYYKADTSGDIEKIRSLSEACDEKDLIYIQKKSAYIESYNNLKYYTKPGPADNSYVVYASYDVKFKDMDTLVPGITPYLIQTREDGSYYIYQGEVDDDTKAYLEDVSAQDDVADLMNKVDVKFKEAIVADEDLKSFLAQLKNNLDVEVGEALAEAAAASEPDEAQEEETGQQTATSGEVKAKDVVNVRASDSEQAEKIGKVQTGDVLKLLESKANGWSKVEFDGKEAYIKSEFLEPVEGNNDNDGQEAAASGNEEGENNGGNSGDAGVSSDIPSSGTVQVAETVNIRKSASETAEKVGVCYQGGKLEIVMQQADGWTKVKFEGKTGYVKTDVIKIMK